MVHRVPENKLHGAANFDLRRKGETSQNETTFKRGNERPGVRLTVSMPYQAILPKKKKKKAPNV
jgi:hypothetical protein